MVLNRARQVLIIKVSTAAKPTYSAAQMLLLGDAKLLGEEEILVLESFKNKLPAFLKDKITTAILFPNIRSDSVGTKPSRRKRKTILAWSGNNTGQFG